MFRGFFLQICSFSQFPPSYLSTFIKTKHVLNSKELLFNYLRWLKFERTFDAFFRCVSSPIHLKKVCVRFGDSSPSNKIVNKGLFEDEFPGTETVTGVQHRGSLYKKFRIESLPIDSNCSKQFGESREEKWRATDRQR